MTTHVKKCLFLHNLCVLCALNYERWLIKLFQVMLLSPFLMAFNICVLAQNSRWLYPYLPECLVSSY
jgi:hypothetical protein